ncbi:MAG: GDSL-type esterase/lipase family protein [Candidatus Howiella sp.]|jgi:acyl-CoA thioesterase-1
MKKKLWVKAASLTLALLLCLSSLVTASAAENVLNLTWPSSWQEGTPPSWALEASEDEIAKTIAAINQEYSIQKEGGYDLGTAATLTGWGDMVSLQFLDGSNVGNPWGDSRKWGAIVAPFAGMAFSIKGYQAARYGSNGAPLGNEVEWTNPQDGTVYVYQLFTKGETIVSKSGTTTYSWGYTVGSGVSGDVVEAMRYAYASSAWSNPTMRGAYNLGCLHSDAKVTADGIVYQEFFGSQSTGASAQSDRGLDKAYGISYIVAAGTDATEAYIVTDKMFTAWASLWGNLDTNSPDRFSRTGVPVGNQYRKDGKVYQDFEKCTLVVGEDPMNPTILSRDNGLYDFAVGENPVLIDGTEIHVFLDDGTPVTAVAPTFTIAETAVVDKVSGETYDCTDPVTFTVTAENGEAVTYTVTVEVGSAPSDADKAAAAAFAADMAGLTAPYTADDAAVVEELSTAYDALTFKQKLLVAEQKTALQEAAAAVAAVVKHKQRVVFVGDSITAPSDGYTAKTAAMFDSDAYSFMNAGQSGYCLSPAADSPFTSLSNYKNSQLFAPNIVFIMLGTNDSKPRNWTDRGVSTRFEQDLKDMVAAYRALDSKPTVVIATSPTVYMDKGRVDTIDNDTVDLIVAIQKKVAEELDCPLLDINAVTKNQDSWFNDNDGVHPNQTGHAGMAEEFAAMVRELSEITVADFAVEGTVFDFSADRTDYTVSTDALPDVETLKDKISATVENGAVVTGAYMKDGKVVAYAKAISATGYSSKTYTVTFTDRLAGDVDGDGNVTVSDVVELRKLIVAGSWTEQQFAAGNLDEDQNLTVSDVVALRALIVAGA